MLKINAKTYLIENIPYHQSINCDERPIGVDIDSIVIHCISLPSGVYDNNHIIDLFQNKLDTTQDKSFISLTNLKVSAHILVRRDGRIIQFVPFNLRAWHAGVSQYKNRENFNDFSIGIEIEGTPTTEYTNIQYEKLIQLIASIKLCYPRITDDNIIGHSDISPNRKKDPGDFFMWDKIKDKK
tara:strand:+ start:22 stop:570 length:549 start_codon:yes stop_codon:yes gene_type:complete